MALELPKLLHLLAALLTLFLLFSHSMEDPFESDLCNFEDESQLDDLSQKVKVNVMNGEGDECHFSKSGGECKSGADCGHACAALGLNPNAVKKCIPSPNPNPHAAPSPNRCCCLVSPKQN